MHMLEDGDQILVVVYVSEDRQTAVPKRFAEYHVVTVDCDEEFFALDCNGERWGWDWSDVEWFLPMKDAVKQLRGLPAAALDGEAKGELDLLRECLLELKSHHEATREQYRLHGPQWTSRESGEEYYSASSVLDSADECLAKIDAALAASAPQP